MAADYSEIENANLLVEAFGYWPRFHDAELFSFNLSRGSLLPEKDSWEFPSIEARLHVFEMTSDVTPDGYFILHKHHLVDFRFEGVEDLHLEGFNHQNVLLGLEFRPIDGSPQRFEVFFDSAFGADAKFSCSRIVITGLAPCGPKGSACA